ncbi:hypothetical protein D3C72_1864600 [compost metagenome]
MPGAAAASGWSRTTAGGVHKPSSTAGPGVYTRNSTPTGPEGGMGSQLGWSSGSGAAWLKITSSEPSAL